jgi:hypothetical protein
LQHRPNTQSNFARDAAFTLRAKDFRL